MRTFEYALNTHTWPHISGFPSCKYTFAGVPGETYDRLELEVQVGPQAEAMLMKKINLSDEEITEGKPVLTKLKELLNPVADSTSSVNKRSNSNSNSRSRSSAFNYRSVKNVSRGSTSASIPTSRSSLRTRVTKVGASEMLPHAGSK